MSPPDSSRVRVVVTDTNILINLIHVGLLDLLLQARSGLIIHQASIRGCSSE